MGVFKRGSVYYIRYELPPRADGKRRQRMSPCPGMTKKEAEAHLAEIKAQVSHGTYIDPSKEKLSDYFDRFMDHCRKLGILTDKTAYEYDGSIRRYIKPEIGHIILGKIRPLQIQEFINKLMTSKVNGGYGLSAKTVYNVYGIFHRALSQAVKWDILARNPCDAIDPPKLRMREMTTASYEELGKLLNAIDKSSFKIPILIAMFTGLRRGEVVGLKWTDFDATAATLCVRRSMSDIPGEQPFPKEPKTGKQRTISLTNNLVQELRQHRQNQLKNRLAFGEAYEKDDGWICTFPKGGHISPSALTTGFIRIRNKLNINIKLHELRHTVVTELLMAGVPIKTVSEIAGHANSTVTLNRYGHTLPIAQQQALGVLDKMLKRAQQSNS